MASKVVEEALDIPASAEAVFDLVHDYERRLLWDPFLREARLLGGAREAGVDVVSLCRAHRGAGGGAMETVYVSFERPRVAAVAMTRGPFYIARFAASIRHRALGADRSRVTYKFVVAARPRWLGGILDPILAWILRRETRRRLEALCAYFENRSRQPLLSPEREEGARING